MNTPTPIPSPAAATRPLLGLSHGSLVKSRKTGRRAQVVSLSATHARLAFSEHAPAWRIDLETLARCYFIA